MVTNIAFIYRPELNFGGVEEHIKSILKSRKPQNFNWFLFAPVSGAYKDSLKSQAVEIIFWNPVSVWSLASLYDLIHLLKIHHISLLHIHSPEVLVIGKLAAWTCRVPVVVTVHLLLSDYFRGKSILANIKKQLYLSVDSILNLLLHPYIIYVSSRDKERSRRVFHLSKKVFVIQNGVDVDRFKDAKRKRSQNRGSFGVSPSTVIITFVGRLDQQKGVDILLDAFYEFKKSFQNTILWLIGDGPLRKEYEIQAMQVEGHAIVFWGFREDVRELLSASDIFVLPSRYEATPIALLEAMASGVPSIATEVGEQIIENKKNGISIPADNVAELTEAIKYLAASKKAREQLGHAGRLRAEDFPVQRMVEEIYHVYKMALCVYEK